LTPFDVGTVLRNERPGFRVGTDQAAVATSGLACSCPTHMHNVPALFDDDLIDLTEAAINQSRKRAGCQTLVSQYTTLCLSGGT
jgi:hypothetical protein